MNERKVVKTVKNDNDAGDEAAAVSYDTRRRE